MQAVNIRKLEKNLTENRPFLGESFKRGLTLSLSKMTYFRASTRARAKVKNYKKISYTVKLPRIGIFGSNIKLSNSVPCFRCFVF